MTGMSNSEALDPKNTFFTSDLHFFHKAIIRFCDRPYATVDEMNEGIIHNWNSKVSEDSTVFVLGDVLFGGSDKARKVLPQLKGKKHLVVGNHDSVRAIGKYFNSVSPYREIFLDESMVCLMHYPIEFWNKCHYGAMHFHGHLHGGDGNWRLSLPLTKRPNRVDVGVDSWHMTPVSFTELKSHLELNNPKMTVT